MVFLVFLYHNFSPAEDVTALLVTYVFSHIIIDRNYLHFSCLFTYYFLYVNIENIHVYTNEKSESYKKNGGVLDIEYGKGFVRGFYSEDVVEVST